MRNFVQRGDVLTFIAPYALASGDGVLVGSLFGIATSSAANGAEAEVKTEGVFDIAALGTDVAAQGAKAYWDNGNRRITTTAAGNSLVGAFTLAKANGDATARVRLNATSV